MINLETIKSLYDDKPTLMRWLRKVEEALKNASLSSLQAVPVEGGKIKFVATFADGSSLESAATAMPSDFQSQITAPSIAIEGEATADSVRADLIESYGDVRSAGLRVSGTANLNDVNITGSVTGLPAGGTKLYEHHIKYTYGTGLASADFRMFLPLSSGLSSINSLVDYISPRQDGGNASIMQISKSGTLMIASRVFSSGTYNYSYNVFNFSTGIYSTASMVIDFSDVVSEL